MMENDRPNKSILIAQRGFNFMHGVPEHMHSVFKDPVYRYALFSCGLANDW